jgi:hypothetical protein
MPQEQLRGAIGDMSILGKQHPIAHPYAKGKAIDLGATPLGTGATSTADLVTTGFATLIALWRIGNATTPATALGDLTAFISPYEDDGSTVFPTAATPDLVVVAAALSGNFAVAGRRYTLGGIDKVKISLTNNNAGGLQGARAVYFLQK